MNRGIYPILSGALAQEQRLQVTANNLANVNTAGFKRDEPLFRSVMTRVAPLFPLSAQNDTVVQPVFNAGRRASERIFVAPQGLDTIFETGRLRSTGNPFDLAIQGPGFFEVKTSQGLRYTRNGIFHLDAKRRLVSETGAPVLVGVPVVPTSAFAAIWKSTPCPPLGYVGVPDFTSKRT